MKVLLIDLNRKDSLVSAPSSAIASPEVVANDAHPLAAASSANGNGNSSAPIPLDSLHGEESALCDITDGQRLEISVLNETDWEFKPQEQFGHIYKSDEFFMFRAQLTDFEKTVGVDIYKITSPRL